MLRTGETVRVEGGEIVTSVSMVAAAAEVAVEPIGHRHVKGHQEAVEAFRVPNARG